jgi:aldose 1-epimerase
LDVELRARNSRVVLDPARGGRLASWTVAGEELLLGPPDASDASIHWGCFVMAPWPGRLANARFEWQRRTIQLSRTHGRHAIHGLTWNRPWRVEAASAKAATLALELPRDEWPMGGRVRQRVELSPSSTRR